MNGINQNLVSPCTFNFDIYFLFFPLDNIYNVNGSRVRKNEPKNRKNILDETSNFRWQHIHIRCVCIPDETVDYVDMSGDRRRMKGERYIISKLDNESICIRMSSGEKKTHTHN